MIPSPFQYEYLPPVIVNLGIESLSLMSILSSGMSASVSAASRVTQKNLAVLRFAGKVVPSLPLEYIVTIVLCEVHKYGEANAGEHTMRKKAREIKNFLRIKKVNPFNNIYCAYYIVLQIKIFVPS